jgi:uncharacterized protein
MNHLGKFYFCDAIMNNDEYEIGSVAKGLNWEKYCGDFGTNTRKECSQCWAKYVCGGTCYVSSKNTHGDILCTEGVECSMSRYFTEKALAILITLIDTNYSLDKLKNYFNLKNGA